MTKLKHSSIISRRTSTTDNNRHGFWTNLPKPFFALAPMADVTDYVFREIVAGCAKPDVMFTEFVSADGLMHPDARGRLLVDLKYSEKQRPIVAQLFGSKSENIKGAAKLCEELGFDGVDINMGCPDRTINKQKAGADLILDHELAREIIDAAKDGTKLPISVKTRMGYNSLDDFEPWMKVLLESGLDAITVHLRTKKEMSKVPAHWELAGELRRLGGSTSKYLAPLLIANGDVKDLSDAKQKARENELDSVMLGRAIYGNPWLFSGHKASLEERINTMIYHTKRYEEEYAGIKSFAIIRKFFGAYIAGHPKAKEFRVALMETKNYADVHRVALKYS